MMRNDWIAGCSRLSQSNSGTRSTWVDVGDCQEVDPRSEMQWNASPPKFHDPIAFVTFFWSVLNSWTYFDELLLFPCLPIPCVFFAVSFFSRSFGPEFPGSNFSPGQTMSIGGIPSDQWVGATGQTHRIHIGLVYVTYIKRNKIKINQM